MPAALRRDTPRTPTIGARGSIHPGGANRARRAALGVLYFENNLTSNAFTPERVEMFRLLSAQMAIAVENSRLFEACKRSEAAFRLLSDTSAAI